MLKWYVVIIYYSLAHTSASFQDGIECQLELFWCLNQPVALPPQLLQQTTNSCDIHTAPFSLGLSETRYTLEHKSCKMWCEAGEELRSHFCRSFDSTCQALYSINLLHYTAHWNRNSDVLEPTAGFISECSRRLPKRLNFCSVFWLVQWINCDEST